MHDSTLDKRIKNATAYIIRTLNKDDEIEEYFVKLHYYSRNKAIDHLKAIIFFFDENKILYINCISI